MARVRLTALAIVALQAVVMAPAEAASPTRDEEFRVAQAACRSLTQARIAEENATGEKDAGPRGDAILRWLVDSDDAGIKAVVDSARALDRQMTGNTPLERAVRSAKAETYCFAENVMRVRRGSTPAAAPAASAGRAPQAPGGVTPPRAAPLARGDAMAIAEAALGIGTAVRDADAAASEALRRQYDQLRPPAPVAVLTPSPARSPAPVSAPPPAPASGPASSKANQTFSNGVSPPQSAQPQPVAETDAETDAEPGQSYKDPKTDDDCVTLTYSGPSRGWPERYMTLTFTNTCNLRFSVSYYPTNDKQGASTTIEPVGTADSTTADLTISNDRWPGKWRFELSSRQ